MKSINIIAFILDLPRSIKRIIVLLLDILFCLGSVYLSYYLRLGYFIELDDEARRPFWIFLISVVLSIPIFIKFGLYRQIFRHTGSYALSSIAKAVGLYGIMFSLIIMISRIDGVPLTIGILQPILLLLLIGISRMTARFFLTDLYMSRTADISSINVIIYGAGVSGRQLMGALNLSPEMKLIGFLDDNNKLSGQVINGKKIYSTSHIEEIINTLNIRMVIIALPKASQERKKAIIKKLLSLNVIVRVVPNLIELLHSNLSISDLKSIEIEDLLGREPVTPNLSLMKVNTVGKVILVTGAGGSIGSEISRQICLLEPSVLLLMDHSEYALHRIYQELKDKYNNSSIKIYPFLSNLRDNNRLNTIFSIWRPHVIYHAAAYKHVHMVEYNVIEGISNNLYSTINLINLAIFYNIDKFVLISTDKAVRPTNIMGASKRLSEMLIQAHAEISEKTIFTIVRFGNVLGSSGSVVPIFKKQIMSGGPVTVTHREVTRYFMTITEAAELVIQAGSMAKGGDVFVLDMGDPIKIYDLAKKLIELSGLKIKDIDNPSGQIEINIVGLRPGEKLHEELLIGEDLIPTDHLRIFKAHEEFPAWGILNDGLYKLKAAMDDNDLEKVYLLLRDLIQGFSPDENIVDYLYSKDKELGN